MNILTSKEIAVDYEWAVQLNRLSLGAIGLWPADYQGRRKFSAIFRAIVSFTLSLFVWTIPSLCSLIVNHDDLMLFMETLGYFITALLVHLKYIVIYKKRKMLLSILNMMAEDWAKLKSDLEKVAMVRRARIGRIIGVVLYTLLTVAVAFMFILPRFGIKIRSLTNEIDIQKTFPIPVYYAQRAYQSPYYEMLYILQLIVTLVICVSYAGVDNLLGILIFHVCSQLENLRARIANIKQPKYFDRVLRSIVKDHIRLMRAVNIIEDTFTLLLLAMLLNFIMYVCIFGFLLLTILAEESHDSKFRILFLLCIITNASLQTFYYCLAGQNLTTESESLYYAVYKCDWLNLKSNEAKSLILIMARAKTPLYVTAGKLFPMTLLTFCQLLKITMSYISFLITRL